MLVEIEDSFSKDSQYIIMIDRYIQFTLVQV